MSDHMPPEIDLIEIIYAMGEMTMADVHAQVGAAAWRVLPGMVSAKSAAMWCVESNGERRRLADWEVAAIVRNRIGKSAEETIPDERLLVRSDVGTAEAYHRDFGGYYYKKLEEAGD